MVSDAIRKIKEAEAQAEELIRQARAEGKRAIADAHEEAVTIVEKTRVEARAEEKRMVDAARSEAHTIAEKTETESAERVEGVRKTAGARISKGVAKVLDSLTQA